MASDFTKRYLAARRKKEEEGKLPSFSGTARKKEEATPQAQSSQTAAPAKGQDDFTSRYLARKRELGLKTERNAGFTPTIPDFRGQIATSRTPSTTRPETTKPVTTTPSTSYLDTARNAGKTTVAAMSTLSEDERKKRMDELTGEIEELNSAIELQQSGISRASVYGSVDGLRERLREDQERLKALQEEYTTLERSGEHTEADELRWQIEDAEKRKRELDNSIPAGEAGGRAAAYAWKNNPELQDEYIQQHGEFVEAKSEQESLEALEAAREYVLKVDEKSYEDDFGGQFGANYRLGRINQDANDAFNRYLINPTEENKEAAYTLWALANEFQKNYGTVLDDEGAIAPWITQDAAGYLPQFLDQKKAEITGGAIGVLGGALVGNPFGGYIAGATAGSGVESYGQMRGAAFRAMIEAGADEEEARAAANDEALINALIEMGGTAISFASLGGTKALNVLADAATKSGSKVAPVLTKLLSKSTVDKAASVAAKEAGKTTGRKVLGVLGGIGLNAGSEAIEEGAQQSVSIANLNREGEGIVDLVKEAGGTLWDAATGKDDAARDEIADAAWQGFKVALMFGGARAVKNNVISHYANAKSNKQRDAVVDAVMRDDEVLSALVEEGKASGENSVSAKIASEIENNLTNGKSVTREQVKSLIAANDVYIKEENRVAAQEEAKSAAEKLGYGEHGRATLASISETQELSTEEVNAEFHLPYLQGLSNMDVSEIHFTSPIQQEAFNAGKLDRIMNAKKDVEKSKFATVYGEESGLVPSAASKTYNPQTVETINKVSKAFGTKTMLEAEIWQKDGKIVPKGTEGAREADAAMRSDGVLMVSLNAGDPIYTLIKHEITHRFQQLAPVEYGNYRDAVMRYVVGNDVSAGGKTSTVERYQNALGLDVNKSSDEIAADFTKKILKDEAEFSRFVDSLLDTESNTSKQIAQNRTFLQKFVDTVREFIDKVRRAFGGDKGKMDEAAQKEFGATVDQLERIESLWKEAAKKSAEVVREKSGETKKSAAQTSDAKLATKHKGESGKYDYETLVAKNPIKVVSVKNRPIPVRGKKIDRNAVYSTAIASAPTLTDGAGNTQRYVHIPDINSNVLLQKKGVEHGLLGNKTNSGTMATAEVTSDLVEILQNSIAVNEIAPRSTSEGEFSYILFGYAKNENGREYIVRSTVTHFSENKSVVESVDVYDVLKGSKAKKMDSELMSSYSADAAAVPSNSLESNFTLSVSDLLQIVKENYPELLSKDVLAHFNISEDVQAEGVQFSLKDVDPVEPTSNKWARGATFAEVKAAHPTLFELDADEAEVRNPTQIVGTVKSYRKIYDTLKEEKFNGSILDASSGLGYGTRAGIDEYGFRVDDIEPFPDASYEPKYTDYSTLDKTYDVIISNAVLNVIPQDLRDAMVVKIGEMLKPGGRAFINVRGTDVKNASSKIPIHEEQMEYFISSSGSYQKGFTKSELKAYLEDALGDGFTVENTNKYGAVAAIVTKDGQSAQFSMKRDRDYLAAVARGDMKTAQKMVDEAAKAAGYDSPKLYHGTTRFGFTKIDVSNSKDGISFFATNNPDTAKTYSGVSGERSIAGSISAEQAEEVVEAALNTVKERSNDLTSAINRNLGYYGLIDYSLTTKQFERHAERAAKGDIDLEKLSDEIYEDWVETVAENWTETDEYQDFAEWQYSSDEWSEIETALTEAIASVIDYADTMAFADTMGNYALYANTEGLLEIDGKGALWRQIKADEIEVGKTWTTRTLAEYAKANGYKGVKFKDIVDEGQFGGTGKPADVYIFFNPQEQVKSADPVTYDNANNAIPLSQRFDSGNGDIRFSMKDSEGATLTKEQREFFKDSKVRDENGNLMVMYHGSEDAGFHEFNTRFSDDSTSFFFANSNTVAKSYSGTREVYAPKTLRTADDLNKFFKEIGASEYAAEERDGTFYLLDDGDEVAESDTASGIYEEFQEWTGIGHGSANYKVYLNITNPLIVDAERNNWNELPAADGKTKTTREYAKEAESKGHDGVIFHNIIDNGAYASGMEQYETSTVAIAFNAEQVKSTENKHPTDDPDIRFSLKGQSSLLDENKKLREVNEALREQFKTTKFAQVDKKQLDAFAKKLLQDYGSGADINETRDALNGLYVYMANGEDGQAPVWSEVQRRAYDAAVSVLEEASTINDDLYQEYKSLRNRLRTHPISISKEYDGDLGGYESINEFRKANFGRIKLTNDGTPVDIVYNDLASTYPEFFDEYHYSTQADQLVHIAEVLDSLQPYEVNPYSYNMREAASWLADDIIERFYELPQAKPTFADKAEQKLTKQVIKDAKKLETLREKKNERIAKLIEQSREKVRKTQQKERTKRAEAVAKVRDHYEAKEMRASDRRKASIWRKKIKKHVDTISRLLLKGNDNSHVPEEMREVVSEFLSVIDLTTPRQKEKTINRLNELRTLYKKIADNETEIETEVDPDLAGYIDDVTAALKQGGETVSVADLNNRELEALYRVLLAVERSIYMHNRAMAEGKTAQISEIAQKVMIENSTGKAYQEHNRVVQWGADMVNMDMLNPQDYFIQLGGTMNDMFGSIRNGFDKKIRLLAEAKSYMDTLLKDVDAKSLSDKKAVAQEFKTGNGQTISLTPAQVMSLYLLQRQKDALDHIYKGGIKPAPVVAREGKDKRAKVKRSYDVVKVTPDDVAKILKSMTPEQQKIADGISKFFTDYTAKWGNEVSLALYGYKKFTVENYFPIVSDQNYLKDVFGETTDATLKNMGSTKARIQGASNPIIIEDALDVFARQADQMSSYNAFVIPLSDIQRVFNFKTSNGSVKQSIEKRYGVRATQYFKKLMTDINGGGRWNGGSQLMNEMVSRYKQAKMGLNLRVVLQQPSAMLRAQAVIDGKYLAQAMATKSGVDLETIYKYAPVAQWKNWGFFSMDTGKQMKDVLLDNKQLSDYTMWAAGKMDEITWKRLWVASELEVRDKQPDLARGSEEYLEAVGKRFSEIIDRTQVVDSVLHRSQIMRNPDALVKMSVAFMNEPFKAYNMVRTAATQFKHNPTQATKQALWAAGVAYMTTLIVNHLITAAVDTWRGDEEDEEWLEKIFNKVIGKDEEEKEPKTLLERYLWHFADNAVNEPLSMFPFVKDVVSMVQGYDVKRMDMQGVGDFVNALTRGLSDKYTIAQKVIDIGSKFGDLLGIPVSSLKRELSSVVKLGIGAADSPLLEYEADKVLYTVTGNKSRFMDILYKAYKAGDMEAYRKIAQDMIDEGITPSYIESGIKSRAKKDGVSVSDMNTATFSAGVEAKYEVEKPVEDKFDINKLSGNRYTQFIEDRGQMLDEIISDFQRHGFGSLDEDTANELLTAAYTFAEDTALEDASSGLYESDTKWIDKAQNADDLGLTVSEYLMLRAEHDSDIGADGVYDAYKAGVDVDTYLDFKDALSDLEYAKGVDGARKAAIIQLLNSMGLTQDEWDYLFGTEYKTSSGGFGGSFGGGFGGSFGGKFGK